MPQPPASEPGPAAPADTLVRLARDYAVAMNAWERDFAREWGAHLQTYVHDDAPARMAAYRQRDEDIQRRHRALYRVIFERCCTPRKRVYGGPDGPLSAGTPTRFDGIGPGTAGHAERRSARRAEVTFERLDGAGPGPTGFRFVLLRAGGAWRIDGFKQWYPGAGAWVNGIL